MIRRVAVLDPRKVFLPIFQDTPINDPLNKMQKPQPFPIVQKRGKPILRYF